MAGRHAERPLSGRPAAVREPRSPGGWAVRPRHRNTTRRDAGPRSWCCNKSCKLPVWAAAAIAGRGRPEETSGARPCHTRAVPRTPSRARRPVPGRAVRARRPGGGARRRRRLRRRPAVRRPAEAQELELDPTSPARAARTARRTRQLEQLERQRLEGSSDSGSSSPPTTSSTLTPAPASSRDHPGRHDRRHHERDPSRASSSPAPATTIASPPASACSWCWAASVCAAPHRRRAS